MRTALQTKGATLVTNRVDTLNLEQLMNWYLENFVPKAKENTRRAKVKDFEELITFASLQHRCSFGELVLADLSPALLYDYRETLIRMGKAPATVNRRMATVKHFSKKVKERAPLWCNPTEGIRDLPVQDAEFRGLDPEEAQALIEAAYQVGTSKFMNGRSGLLMELKLATGLRAAEIISLTVGHLNANCSILRSVRCKGDVIRDVAIRSDVSASIRAWLPFREQILCDYLPGYKKLHPNMRKSFALLPTFAKAHVTKPETTQMDYKTLWRTFADACKIADREHVNPHRARHFFCREFLEATGDIVLTSQAAGHRNINTTAIYLKRGQAAITAGIEKMGRR